MFDGFNSALSAASETDSAKVDFSIPLDTHLAALDSAYGAFIKKQFFLEKQLSRGDRSSFKSPAQFDYQVFQAPSSKMIVQMHAHFVCLVILSSDCLPICHLDLKEQAP